MANDDPARPATPPEPDPAPTPPGAAPPTPVPVHHERRGARRAWALGGIMTPGKAGVETLRTACLLILTGLALMFAMYMLRVVLVPFVLALFLSLLVSPLINAMVHRLRWPRWLAVSVTFLMSIGLLAGTVAALVPAAVQLITAADQYRDRVLELWEGIATPLGLDEVPVEAVYPEGAEQPPPDWISPVPASEQPPTERQNLNRWVREQAGPFITTLAYRVGGSIMLVLANGLLVSVILLFLLMGRGNRPIEPDSLRGQIERRIQRYLGVMLVISALTGLFVGVTLELLGVPFGWLFGVLAFVLNFIPNIGSIVATLLPLPFVLLNPELSVPVKVMAIAIPAALQFGIGSVLAPKLLGDALGLSPVVVLLGLIYFGTIWGPVGLLLSTPLLASLRIAFARVPLLQPVAIALSGGGKLREEG